MNTFKKIFPIVIIIIAIGVAGYFIGNLNGKSQAVKDQSASVLSSQIIANDWWPAGGGFCYHKIKSTWGSYWVLGEISGTKCVDIALKEHLDNLEILIKKGALQSGSVSDRTSVPSTK